MSSRRKIDSACANGKKSHGPITEEGRKKSSMNALKLGLTARTVVFPNENHDEYDALRDSYIEHLQPADPVEMDLVMDMVNAKWQQRRLNNSETAMFEVQMEKQKEELAEHYESYSEIFAQTYAFQQLSESGSLQTLHRTLSRLERTYSRALNNLLRLRQVPKSNPVATSGRAATVRESVVREAAPIQENEKRTQSQVRTPVPDNPPPLPEPQPHTHPAHNPIARDESVEVE